MMEGSGSLYEDCNTASIDELGYARCDFQLQAQLPI